MTLSNKAAAFSIDSLLKDDPKTNDRSVTSNLDFSRAYENINTHYLSDLYNSSERFADRGRSGDFGKRNQCTREEKKGCRKVSNAVTNSLVSEDILLPRRQSDNPEDRSPRSEYLDDSSIRCRSGSQSDLSHTISKTKNGITVSLEEPELWSEFHKHGTEMILNRAGRRMFPCVVASITGLNPTATYSLKMEICAADAHRYKFINNKWLPVGKADPELPNKAFEHPDSPGLGKFWMNTKISFAKVKITNNKDNLGKHTVLHSMHKYTPIIMIKREGECNEEEEAICFEFEEASFIAVTAYQNEQVTQLKIQNNPFAKAFRDADVTAILQGAYMLTGSPIGAYQALYGSDVFPVNVPIEIDGRDDTDGQPMKRVKTSCNDQIWQHHDIEAEMSTSTQSRAWQRGSRRVPTSLLSNANRYRDSPYTSLSSIDSGFREDFRDRYMLDDVPPSYPFGYNPYLPVVRSTSNLSCRSATSQALSSGSYLLQVPHYSRQMSRSTGSVSCTTGTGNNRVSSIIPEDLSTKRHESAKMDGVYKLTRCASETIPVMNTRRGMEEFELMSLCDKKVKSVKSEFCLMKDELDKTNKHTPDIKLEPINLTNQQ